MSAPHDPLKWFAVAGTLAACMPTVLYICQDLRSWWRKRKS